MLKSIKKRLALVIAVALVFTGISFNLVDVRAAEGETGSVTNGKTVTWDASAILAATAGDNGLTLKGDGWTKNDSTDEKIFTDGFSALGANAKAGSTKASNDVGQCKKGEVPTKGCYIQYDAQADGTLSIYTKTGKGKTFFVVDSDAQIVAQAVNTGDASTYDIVTATVKAGKTYYAYLGGATAQVWQVVFEKSPLTTWDAESILASGTGDRGLTLKGDGWTKNDSTDEKIFADGFSALGANAKSGSAKASNDAGQCKKGEIPTKGCYLEFTAAKEGTLNIYEKTGKGKTFYVVDSDANIVAQTANSSDGSTYDIVSVNVEVGKTYYAYLAGATAQVWQVVFDETPYDKSWDAAAILASGTCDRGLTLKGDGWTKNDSTDEKEFADGFSALGANAKSGSAKASNDAGQCKKGEIPTKGCYLEYTATGTGTLKIYEKTGKGKTFYVVDSDANIVAQTVNSSDGSTYDIVEAEVVEGKTYYAYLAGATAQIWKVDFKAPTGKEAKPWDEVETPVINSVSLDADGNFVVDISAVIDKYDGASTVTVTMMTQGGQAAEETFKAAKDGRIEANFTPNWNGDYTFVATAQREGEVDKVSNTYEYKDYVLAVKRPVVTWVQNKGNGTVYLDWVNIEDADYYNVSYKLSDADDSTYVEKKVIEGEATLTGLEAGKTYTVKVVAVRESDGYTGTATKNFTVSEQAAQEWFVATVGSAQNTDAVIETADGTKSEIHIASTDSAAVNGGTKTQLVDAVTLANTTGSITFAGQTSGKISDDEDGLSYYFTKIDPDTENFTISATFEITDTSLTPDNQTGFGIMAADMLGINNWGKPSYVHKYFNYFSAMAYSSKSSTPSMRYITGYTSADASNKDGVERANNNISFSDLKDANLLELGKKYTFTVSKTDEGYTATVKSDKGEQTMKLDENALTSVQEDGSVCVGVFASRKISVKISDIKFEKTTSKGVVGTDASDEKVKPSFAIYSSDTCGASEYEYIAVANCEGTFTITNNAGKTETVDASADQVVRVNLPINEGKNTINASFAPKAGNVTSTDVITKETVVNCVRYGKEGNTIYVANDGSADGLGTSDSPLDLATAVKYAQPGQVIVMKNGVYDKGATIPRSASGTADKKITLVAELVSTNGEDGVVIKGSGLIVIGSYWNVYGIYVKDAAGVGIQISGNYNTIEMCTVEHASNTGVQVSRSGSADNKAGIEGQLWPTGNLIKNCESFDNCDAGRNDADGFAAKLTCGNGNKFYGCISHNNIDDGWDLYAKSITGEIGKVVIENCVAYNNGWCTFDFESADTYSYGEGNGFKLGGGYLKGGHELINSVSFGNHAKGVTSNSCPDIVIKNVTSFGNGNEESYSVGLNTMDSMLKEWKVSGLISMTTATKKADLIPFSLHSEDNYIFDGANSYNSQGISVDNNWFTSVDLSINPTRNADGTINMHDLLVLTDKAPSNSGARLDVTSDSAKSSAPALTEEIEVLNGIHEKDGKLYWYENGFKLVPEGSDKEVYDPATDAWYLLDAADGGAAVVGKEVYIGYADGETGKWVRYDETGKMIKGFFTDAEGNNFCYDTITGAMIKGAVEFDGISYFYDEWDGKGADGWKEVDGVAYWYEAGVRQGYNGTDETFRGKEIYDPTTDAWYWLDNVQNGAVAKGKDVYMESQADAEGNIGKWVRYDADGHMVKGWNTNENGTYYFDPIYGTMLKGTVNIDGKNYRFNEATGILEDADIVENGFKTVDGREYWYEDGVLQGVKYNEDGSIDESYRGKEIYDGASDAWYFLDAIQGGAKTVSKDVYMESQADAEGNIGKWVRYDADGHMVKGWNTNENGTYYFDPIYGTMAKGTKEIDGVIYTFDETTGICIQN